MGTISYLAPHSLSIYFAIRENNRLQSWGRAA
jgi:hypothetical protein